MRAHRSLLMLAVGAALAASACGSEAPAERVDGPQLVRTMTEAGWSRGDVSVFDERMADSVTFHYAGTPRRLSREDMKATILRWRAAFPDLRMEVDELIAEGDLVAGRFTLSGTHRGEWGGAAPTGERVSMALMMFFRFEDGRLVELWESDDQLGLRRQLGLGAGG